MWASIRAACCARISSSSGCTSGVRGVSGMSCTSCTSCTSGTSGTSGSGMVFVQVKGILDFIDDVRHGEGFVF